MKNPLRAVSWYAVDQGLSSVGNFVLSVMAARWLTAEGLGAFAITFSAYLVAIGTARSASTDILLVRGAGGGRDLARTAIGLSVVIGIGFASAAFAAAALLFRSSATLSGALAALALLLPFLLLQDAFRFVSMESRRPMHAVSTDGIWLLTFVGVLLLVPNRSLWVLILAWGGTGVASGLAHVLMVGVFPRFSHVLTWLRSNRDLSFPFIAQFGLSQAGSFAALSAVSVIAGLDAVGEIRAAQILFSPLGTLFTAFSLWGMVEFRPDRTHGRQLPPGSARRVTASLLPITVAWSLVVWFLPDAIGELLLGANLEAARRLLLPIALLWAGAALSVGPQVLLRLAEEGRSIVRTQAVIVGVRLVLASGGAGASGALGAASGLAAADVTGSILWWKAAIGLREPVSVTRDKEL